MRRAGIVVACVLGALALAVVGLALFFPAERAARYVAARVTERTGRPMEIGSSSVRILPRVRVVLDDVRFGGEPAPGAPSVALDRIELGVELLPLLARRLDVREARLVRPVVEAVSGGPGGEAPAKRPAPDDSAEGGGAFSIRIESFSIESARVVVRLPDGTPLVELAGLHERLRAEVGTGGDVSLVGTTTLDTLRLRLPAGTLGERLTIGIQKTLRYDASDDRVTIEEGTIDLAGVPVRVTGAIEGVADARYDAALDIAGGPGDLASILGFLPSGMAPGLDGARSSGRLTVAGTVTGPLADPAGPRFRFDLALEDGRIEHPRLPSPIEDVRLVVRATPDSLAVEEMRARTRGSSVDVRAAIAEYRTKPVSRIALDFDLDVADAAAFAPALAARALTGRAAGGLILDRDVLTISGFTAKIGTNDLSLDGRVLNPMALDTTRTGLGRARATLRLVSGRLDLDQLRGTPTDRGGEGGIPPLPPLDGTLAFEIGALRVNRLDARNARGSLDLEKGVVTLRETRGGAFSGRVALSGTMTLEPRDRPTFDIIVDADSVRVGEVLAYNPKLARLATVAGHLTGTMSTRTTMAGALDDTLGLDVASLLSQGQVLVRGATLAGHPVQRALGTFLSAPSMESVKIRELVQAFQIENGRLTFEGIDLRAREPELEVMGSGFSALDGSYGLSLDLWLPRSIAEGVRRHLPAEIAPVFFSGTEGKLLIPVRVTGAGGGTPKVGLETDRLTTAARDRAKEKLEDERSRLVDDAKRAIGRRLFGTKKE